MKSFAKSALALSLVLIPAVVSAQIYYPSTGPLSTINNANDILRRLASFGDVIIYLLMGLAVLYIVYSSVRYFVMGKEGDEGRREAGMHIFWGLVGLFVIVSLWGLVNILINTFPVNNQVPNTVPSANFIGGSSSGGGSSGRTSTSDFQNVITPSSNDYYDGPGPTLPNGQDSNGLIAS